MTDSEDEGIPEPPETGGGSGGPFSWLTSGTAFVKALAGLVGAIGILVAALVSAGVIGGSDGNGGGTTTEGDRDESGFSEPPGLFRELTRPDGHVHFEDDTMVVTASEPGTPFLHLADVETQQDVAVTVSAARLSGTRDYGAGVVCRYQRPGTYYLLSVLSKGEYNVLRYDGGRARSLVGGAQASPYVESGGNTIEAKCVGDTTTVLTLSVNGRRVARVQDDSALETGSVGVRIGSSEARITCRFEAFVLRSLSHG